MYKQVWIIEETLDKLAWIIEDILYKQVWIIEETLDRLAWHINGANLPVEGAEVFNKLPPEW